MDVVAWLELGVHVGRGLVVRPRLREADHLVRVGVGVRVRVRVGVGVRVGFGFGFGLGLGLGLGLVMLDGHQQHAPCWRHEACEGGRVGPTVGGLDGDEGAAVEGRVERGQAERAWLGLGFRSGLGLG